VQQAPPDHPRFVRYAQQPAIEQQRRVRAPQIVESQIAEAEQGGPPWLAMEDDCWSIEALRDVNSLAASIALKEEFKER
jgi:hypothetical protein